MARACSNIWFCVPTGRENNFLQDRKYSISLSLKRFATFPGATMTDLAIKLSLLSVSPISLHLASFNHQTLFAILLIIQPLIVLIFVSHLLKRQESSGQLNQEDVVLFIDANSTRAQVEEYSDQLTPVDSSLKKGVSRLQQDGSFHQNNLFKCFHGTSKAYNYLRYWVYSAHATLLWSLSQSLVSSRQISTRELVLLYSQYCLVSTLIKYNSSRRYFEPSRSLSFTMCNLLHLAILIQHFYLNITYSCATKPLRLAGMNSATTKVIWPYECYAIFDRDDTSSRSTMFSALFSGQFFTCHLVLMVHSFRGNESRKRSI